METLQQDEYSSSSITRFAGLSTARTSEHLLPIRRFGAERHGDKQELVALAISALRQADDATEQAFKATGRAQRDRFVFGTIGALGVAFGLASAVLGSGGAGTTVADASTVKVLDHFRPSAEGKHAPVVFADRTAADALAPVAETEPAPTIMPAVYIRPLPLPPSVSKASPEAPVRHTRFVPHFVPSPMPAVMPVAAPPHSAFYQFVHNIFH